MLVKIKSSLISLQIINLINHFVSNPVCSVLNVVCVWSPSQHAVGKRRHSSWTSYQSRADTNKHINTCRSLVFLFHPTCMSSDCGKKPEKPMKKHCTSALSHVQVSSDSVNRTFTALIICEKGNEEGEGKVNNNAFPHLFNTALFIPEGWLEKKWTTSMIQTHILCFLSLFLPLDILYIH